MGLAFSIASASAANLGREQAEMQRAVQNAQNQAQKGYRLQSAGPNIDAKLSNFVAGANQLMQCANTKSNFAQQYQGVISQARSIMNNAQQLQSNATLKAIAAPVVDTVLAAATPAVQQLVRTCQSMGTGTQASGNKYEQVAAVMRREFSGGDLGPNSRAVRHAADVDMPARGGTPEALRRYLNSQNGVVKKWYRDNFQLR